MQTTSASRTDLDNLLALNRDYIRRGHVGSPTRTVGIGTGSRFVGREKQKAPKRHGREICPIVPFGLLCALRGSIDGCWSL
jgi:hypothetical protein